MRGSGWRGRATEESDPKQAASRLREDCAAHRTCLGQVKHSSSPRQHYGGRALIEVRHAYREPAAVSSCPLQDSVVDRIILHVDRVGAHGVPAAARSAATVFIADTFAVGIAGSVAPWRSEILDLLISAGGTPESTVFGGGERLPLMHAAMLNAYQIHAQEFDCVHEKAVVHPMAATLPVLLGWAERDGGVSGALLIRATVVAVDVAATLGL